jgi:hypothetical protein
MFSNDGRTDMMLLTHYFYDFLLELDVHYADVKSYLCFMCITIM